MFWLNILISQTKLYQNTHICQWSERYFPSWLQADANHRAWRGDHPHQSNCDSHLFSAQCGEGREWRILPGLKSHWWNHAMPGTHSLQSLGICHQHTRFPEIVIQDWISIKKKIAMLWNKKYQVLQHPGVCSALTPCAPELERVHHTQGKKSRSCWSTKKKPNTDLPGFSSRQPPCWGF